MSQLSFNRLLGLSIQAHQLRKEDLARLKATNSTVFFSHPFNLRRSTNNLRKRTLQEAPLLASHRSEELEDPGALSKVEEESKNDLSFMSLQHVAKDNNTSMISHLSVYTSPEKGENPEEPIQPLRALLLPMRPAKNSNWQRIKMLVSESIPVYIYSIVPILMDSITSGFLGHYSNSTVLTGVGLGNSWINATGLVILVGFTASLNTLSSQEGGRGNFEEVGLQYHKCLMISLVLVALINGMNQWISVIFSALGQMPEIIPFVETYVRIASLSLIPFSLSNATISFLESQKLFRPQSIATVLTLLVHPVACFVMIGWLGMEAEGAGWAMVITQTISAMILFSIVFFRYYANVRKSFFWLTKKSFSGFSEIMKTGALTCLLTCLEWWCLEASSFLAGRCGVSSAAAHATVAVPVENLIYLMAYSVATVTQSYLGNYMGEDNQKEFLAFCKLGPMIGFLLASGAALLVLVFKSGIPYLIIDDKEVAKISSEIFPLMVTYVVFDCVQVLFGAIMKGIGKFDGAIWSNIVPFYGVGLPMAYYFAYVYRDKDVVGIWSGILVGIICVNMLYGVIILRININKEMEEFRDKVLDEIEEEMKASVISVGMEAKDLMDFYVNSKKKKSAVYSVADKKGAHPVKKTS